MLKRVKERFNIHLYPPTVHFLYLSTRNWVLASTWPRFTLLGQSLGSLVLAFDAFTLLVPDIFIDTMGYAFALGLSSLLFPAVPTGAYVHYPTISTDMLESLQIGGQGGNAGLGAGYRGGAKKKYWQLFAQLYSRVGGSIDVVMTNSTWTQGHIKSLWEPYRMRRSKPTDINVVFPPVAVEEVAEAVQVSQDSEKQRGPYLLYIAQFRPEKNHQLILKAFASFLHSKPKLTAYHIDTPKLVLIGSVRGSHDDAKRVYELRLLARELHIKDNVEFICDAPWPQMLEWMRKASVGVNGMWNEHFGIGVVEYQAAGLIPVVNNSGGPKLDIVVDVNGKSTGKLIPHEYALDICADHTRISCQYKGRVCRRISPGIDVVATRDVGDEAACSQVCRALHRPRICRTLAEEYGDSSCLGSTTVEEVKLMTN